MARRPVLAPVIGALVVLGVSGLLLQTERGFAVGQFAWSKLRGGYTVDERVEAYSAEVASRVSPSFVAAGIPFPPRQLAYLAFKDRRELQVYSRTSATEPWKYIRTYAVRGLSGRAGPKLREGDRQVPEGIYSAESLNPNSRFFLSIRLSYPNDFDRAQAKADGRAQLGSDIMIHGTDASVGCLAMGNEAAEDLFVLAALAGRENVRIIVAPTDFRRQAMSVPESGPAWLPSLYLSLETALRKFPGEA